MPQRSQGFYDSVVDPEVDPARKLGAWNELKVPLGPPNGSSGGQRATE